MMASYYKIRTDNAGLIRIVRVKGVGKEWSVRIVGEDRSRVLVPREYSGEAELCQVAADVLREHLRRGDRLAGVSHLRQLEVLGWTPDDEGGYLVAIREAEYQAE